MRSEIKIKELVSYIREQEWLIGAVNYDEDVHFSSYYLRASLDRYTNSLYPGYSKLISIYQDFNEQYYLLKNECINTSKKIIAKAEAENGWLNDILNKVIEGYQKLELVFDNSMDAEFFGSISDDELINIYKKHHKIHSEIYVYARLPEALDRGVSYFTTYLKQIVKDKIGSQNEYFEVFEKLTQPVSPSILSQALYEYDHLLSHFVNEPDLKHILLHSTSKARMLFPQYINQSLLTYLAKWKYLNYHGYGKRELTSFSDLIERLAKSLKGYNDRESNNNFDHFLQNKNERDSLLNKLNLSAAQRQLFEIFPRIGEVKLLRRFIQLRNFYFLDLLICELSKRLNCTEWTLRNMLPEEIIESFDRSRIQAEIQSRQNGCVYIVLDDNEYIVDSQNIPIIQKELEKSLSVKKDRKILKGVVACRGSIKGTCKIVIRPDRTTHESFSPGTILVSQSTDPDLLNILKISGAVLTEQGGVTSHAALICRELGIPTIIGVEGLLDNVSDGDTLEVDAENGIVRIIEPSFNTPNFIIRDSEVGNHKMIGGKAERLITLKKMGFQVPKFVLIDSDQIRKQLLITKRGNLKNFKAWLQVQLDIDEQSKLAIRSSSIYEDTKETSSAGKYESILNVPMDSIEKSIEIFLKKNDLKSPYKYKGTIIIQRMLSPDFSGVCITHDKRIAGNNMVIELICGNNAALTSGFVCPDRYFVQRKSGDIEKKETKNFQSDRDNLNIRWLAKELMKIEEAFGCALDIEWALKGEVLSILQVRPII